MALSATVLQSLLETIWVDFVLKNPLQVDVELADLTVVVKEAGKTQTNESQEGLVVVEEIDKISLAPGEQRTVSGSMCHPSPVLNPPTRRTTDPNLHQIPSTNKTCAHRTHLQIPCFDPLLRASQYPRATTQRYCCPKTRQNLRSGCVR